VSECDDQRSQRGQKLNALLELSLDVRGLKADQRDVVPFLAVLEELIVELAPADVQQSGLDELLMERGAHARMLCELELALQQAALTA